MKEDVVMTALGLDYLEVVIHRLHHDDGCMILWNCMRPLH